MQPKRSREWLCRGLFILSGIWTAIFLPITIIIVGFMVPFADAATLTRLLRLSQDLVFNIFIFLTIVLPIWYGLYRISHLLRNVNIHLKRADLIFFSLAFFWSAYCGYVIFIWGKG